MRGGPAVASSESLNPAAVEPALATTRGPRTSSRSPRRFPSTSGGRLTSLGVRAGWAKTPGLPRDSARASAAIDPSAAALAFLDPLVRPLSFLALDSLLLCCLEDSLLLSFSRLDSSDMRAS